MNARAARTACVVLASHTGWGLRDLLDLDLDDLTAWLETVREVNNP